MRTVTLGSTSITLQLWDTAGQERLVLRLLSLLLLRIRLSPRVCRFRCITDQYYRKADAILVVYDITCSASFTAVREWIDTVEVSRWMLNQQCCILQFVVW